MTETLNHGVRSATAESQDWLDALGAVGPIREEAAVRLHGLLLAAAHSEVTRRCRTMSGVSYSEREDLAMEAADDAVVAILGKLHTFRGESRFTTWAYKFVLLEAGVRLRRRSWQGREVSLDVDPWFALAAAGPSAHQVAEEAEVLDALQGAVRTALTLHQREVFAALALNGVPIDVLAERRNTTRGALYKTLHDARRKLRGALAAEGLAVGGDREG